MKVNKRLRLDLASTSQASPRPQVFSQMALAYASVRVRICTGITPANCYSREGCQCASTGCQRNCCWLFVPNDEAPSELGWPTAAPVVPVLVSTSHFSLRWLFHNRIRMSTPFTPDADVLVNHYYSPDPPNSGIGYISHSILAFNSSIYSDNCL
jgi:hypothetical protein